MSIMNTLQHLIALLEEVKHSQDITTYRGEKGQHVYLDPSDNRIMEIEKLASWILFTDKGRCDFDAMMELKRHKYHIFPGQQNDMGWLIGCIEISGRGVIVYYNETLLKEEI